MRRLAVLLIFLALCVPALAGLPAWKRPDARPVTDLRCEKSGDDVVLTWTTAPAGTYRYIVCRGILQPRFHAQRIVANTTDLTWTDEDACLRTRHGQLVSEFYRVYACEQPKPPPLKPKAVQSEYLGRPRDKSVAVKYTLTNGDQFAGTPMAVADGRDGDWGMPAQHTPDPTVYLFDLVNFDDPRPATIEHLVIRHDYEQYVATVDHGGYYAGANFTPAGEDEVAPSTTARAVPTPSVTERVGNLCTVGWVAPTQDVAGTVASVKLYRSYLGVQSGESSVLVATVAPAVTSAQDTITAVTAGWYVFYSLSLVYLDGSESNLGPSSTPILR